MNTPVDTLLVRRGDSVPNDLARLKGARLVTAAESEQSKRLAESLIKSLTGDKEISARFLYGEYFDYTPTFKIFFVTNHRPEIRGQDVGIWRRVRLIPFTEVISPKKRIKDLDKTIIQEEASGILSWAVRGCLLWREKGLDPPKIVTAATTDYKTEEDYLLDYRAERMDESNSSAETLASDLYYDYKEWCKDNSDRAVGRTTFGRMLRERGFRTEKKKPGICWSGLQIKR